MRWYLRRPGRDAHIQRVHTWPASVLHARKPRVLCYGEVSSDPRKFFVARTRHEKLFPIYAGISVSFREYFSTERSPRFVSRIESSMSEKNIVRDFRKHSNISTIIVFFFSRKSFASKVTRYESSTSKKYNYRFLDNRYPYRAPGAVESTDILYTIVSTVVLLARVTKELHTLGRIVLPRYSFNARKKKKKKKRKEQE